MNRLFPLLFLFFVISCGIEKKNVIQANIITMPLNITVKHVRELGIDIYWDKDNSEGLIGRSNDYIFKYISYSFYNDKNELLSNSSQMYNDSYTLKNIWIRSLDYSNGGYRNSSNKIITYFTTHFGNNYQKGLIKYNVHDNGRYAYIWSKDNNIIALYFITIDDKTKIYAFSKMTKDYYSTNIVFEPKSFDIN
ncbi:MAG: hypothetical protein HY761_10245 [Candidatus Omnitrophica bacterium]|nr:hypothetical protein [Candidatus Omnitrophota bacterium]